MVFCTLYKTDVPLRRRLITVDGHSTVSLSCPCLFPSALQGVSSTVETNAPATLNDPSASRGLVSRPGATRRDDDVLKSSTKTTADGSAVFGTTYTPRTLPGENGGSYCCRDELCRLVLRSI